MTTIFVDCEINSYYPHVIGHSIGAEFSFARVGSNKTIIKLRYKDTREFVRNATGKNYTTIVLEDDDPLLSMIMLKFKGREET